MASLFLSARLLGRLILALTVCSQFAPSERPASDEEPESLGPDTVASSDKASQESLATAAADKTSQDTTNGDSLAADPSTGDSNQGDEPGGVSLGTAAEDPQKDSQVGDTNDPSADDTADNKNPVTAPEVDSETNDANIPNLEYTESKASSKAYLGVIEKLQVVAKKLPNQADRVIHESNEFAEMINKSRESTHAFREAVGKIVDELKREHSEKLENALKTIADDKAGANKTKEDIAASPASASESVPDDKSDDAKEDSPASASESVPDEKADDTKEEIAASPAGETENAPQGSSAND